MGSEAGRPAGAPYEPRNSQILGDPCHCSTPKTGPRRPPQHRRPGRYGRPAGSRGRLAQLSRLAQRLPVPQLLRLSTMLALAAVLFLVWTWLGVWAKQGLDFSVYWHGGKILNEAGAAPSDLYRGNIDWAGGPQLPFTYPPFAALLFSLLARLPEPVALTMFNAAGTAVAGWLAAARRAVLERQDGLAAAPSTRRATAGAPRCWSWPC